LYLKGESPLLCSEIISNMSMYMPGATAVGITFNGGIVLASEKRIAFGNFLVSKSTKKTFSITSKVGATCAGLVADMQILTLQIAALAKIRKMELKRDVPPNTVAKMMSNMMYERRYFPLLTQVIVGGVVDKPIMYTLDPLGSVLPDEYAAVGTGAEMALGVLDPQFKPNMTQEEAIDLAKRAVRSAALRDSASGDGLDILVITKDGTKEFTEKI
jgi:proteasome beta subunit